MTKICGIVLVVTCVAAGGGLAALPEACVEISASVSPAEALAQVRAKRASGEIAKDAVTTVVVAPGEYALAEELEVTGDVAPIKFVGPKDGRAVFSGGVRLGPFTAAEAGEAETARAGAVWRCSVPKGLVFEQLWVNGERAQIAREPNEFYHYILEEADEGIHPVTGKRADLSRIKLKTSPKAVECLTGLTPEELSQALVHVWWSWNTEWRRPAVAETKESAIYLAAPISRNVFQWPKYCPRITIENSRKALDAPGEWFLDRAKGELLYVPRPGEKPETTYAVAPKLERLVFVHDADGVSFEGISFAYNAFLMPEKGFYPRQSATANGAALEVSNAAHVVFYDCRVEHTADYGLWFNDLSRDCEVRHCWFDDLGAGGVRAGARKWSATEPERVVERIRIDDNVICHGGKTIPSGTGIFLTYVRDSVVTHNEVCDFFYSGLCSGWCWGYGPHPNRNIEISWNHFRNLGKGVLSDMGFVYTLGNHPGTIVMGNHGHDIFSYGYTGSGGTGLYPDEGSRGILWMSNLVHHTKTAALSQHYGRENLFVNNIFAFNTKPGSSVAGRWRPEKHLSLACTNNIFCWGAEQHAWRGRVGQADGVKAPINDLSFGRNLWWSPDGVKSNDFNAVSFAEWQKDGMDEGSIVADPLFVDWERGDWRLKAESPAFALGFKEWDYTLAGVRKDDVAWRRAAEAVVPETFKVAPEPPANPGKSSFSTDFEIYNPGQIPQMAFITKGADPKYLRVTDKEYRSGNRCLEMRDAKGLKPSYMPHVYRTVKMGGETLEARFSIKCDEKANFEFGVRDYNKRAKNGQFANVMQLMFSGKRMIVRHRGGELDVPVYAPGKWLDVRVTMHAASNVSANFDVEAVNEAGERFERKGMLFRGSDAQRPTWVGFISWADWETVTYIDDFAVDGR